ncbi:MULTISPECIES: SDR family oxidoreductase [unclassified Paludibacterium]|uniref:SDR family NAD(P)-dependent oxidoreductase n=1 Tax=unclassified Paludibacterium TaxID=2618429 RepID=UPI001C05A664|nr:SDR family oxidoreductase [Paludibacterium sp. B53371]BEV71785.1 SDR family oxidoreductase [Paludibacterium sp. THUN1379]
MSQPRRALITGASSGLGADFARQLAARGNALVLVARSEAPMQALADELRQRYQVDVQVLVQDLGQPGAAIALKQQTDRLGWQIDVLVNNAGFGVHGEFHRQPLPRLQDMLQLNISTLTELTHCYAADMVARGQGEILLVSSIGAYQATPTYAAYSASKAYVLLLGEALHEELRPYGVTVSVVAPGITATQFLAVSGQRATPYQKLVMMQSPEVVRQALALLRRRGAARVPGWVNRLTVFFNRFMPRSWQRKVAFQLMRND